LRVDLVPMQSLPAADLVIVPGANRPHPQEIDDWLAARAVQKSIGWLQAQAGEGAALAASCAGTFVLAETGLLDGGVATTSWWLAPHFRRRYPQVELDMDKMVVGDGRLLCAGAAFSQADLMLELVARHAGPALAQECARYLMLDRRSSQMRYAIPHHLARQHPVVCEAERWIRRRLDQPFRLGELASALHLTPRTLARRFEASLGMTPLRFVQRLRVEQARHLLQTTRLPLQAVAERVGYAEAATLRKLLARSGEGGRLRRPGT
jgi:transcriptional regulator GlxA family with amidase domain